MAVNPKSPPPTRFGQPEKRNWVKLILFLIFVVAGAAAILWMIKADPRQRPLVCKTSSDVAPSLGDFSRCTEQE